ncbi:DUF3283 family protein [Vibrio owensii]|uniref:DUF3283 family protein n=1 Tax=Vibrio owensii TaxID=696485 RepID=UPI0018F2384B
MSEYNIACKPEEERQRIELDKKAAFLIWKLRNSKIVRSVIDREVASIEDLETREYFQGRLNYYNAQ